MKKTNVPSPRFSANRAYREKSGAGDEEAESDQAASDHSEDSSIHGYTLSWRRWKLVHCTIENGYSFDCIDW